MRDFVLTTVLTVLMLLAPADRAGANALALLVGVSDYDESIGLADLRGPANDVRLLRSMLEKRGGFDVRVLADGVEGSEIPTRAAILGALDRLAEDAGEGSFVYIHLSGHGTQQADRSGDESDGMDEVFLPADTARAEPGTSVIPNAIVDEELGARVAAIRARGADVWLVLDSCHSGSGLRAGSPRVASRFVDPAVLGVSVAPAPEPVTTAAVEGPGDDDLPGGFLAFYAAQSSEVAREIQIDEADADSWYGLFTSRLAARLEADAGLTYRQLFQAILDDLNSDALPGSARLQTPLWDGTLIDAPVFGGSDVAGIRQFAVEGGLLRAGKLHGLADNTLVALVNDAAAGADDILGFAQLEGTDALDASLAAVAGDCVARVGEPCARLGPLPQGARFARVVARPVDTALTLAPPAELATGAPLAEDHPLAADLAAAVARTNAEQGLDIRIEAGADVSVGVADGALWFGQVPGIGETPVGLRWAPEDGPLDPLLARIARAEEIAAMLENVAGTPSLLFPSPVEILVEGLASDPARIAPDTPDDLIRECRAAQQSGDLRQELAAGQALKQCDMLAFGAKGVVQGPARDVNRVYIDSQFCVQAEYQRVEGVAQPARIGQPMTVCSDCPDGRGGADAKAGAERMYFVVTEAEPNREALNLEGLLDTCGTAEGATRSGARQTVEDFLGGLASAGATRGLSGGFGISSLWVEKFNWQVLPRREALAQAGLR